MSTDGPSVSKEFFDKAVEYDQGVGSLVWKYRTAESFPFQPRRDVWNERYAARVAGHTEGSTGRLRLSICSYNYYAVRVIFVTMTGKPPDSRVIYRDGDDTNLKWANLTTTKGRQRERRVLPKRDTPTLRTADLLLNKYLTG